MKKLRKQYPGYSVCLTEDFWHMSHWDKKQPTELWRKIYVSDGYTFWSTGVTKPSTWDELYDELQKVQPQPHNR
jgi:hypothetical protein